MLSPKITLPSDYGPLDLFHFQFQGQEGVVAFNGAFAPPPLLRLHSSCVFSESFRTQDCDCALQLDASLRHIQSEGGIVIYLYQEGRGTGLRDKTRAISIQQSKGLDTASAFAELGHAPDPRIYDAAIEVLRHFGISTVALATNNPKKIAALEAAGIRVEGRVALKISTTAVVDDYIKSKRDVLGHHEND